ncbi:hypothetical protein GCM10023191_013440 [Actinoallomurus oryzae]|uniref:Uncharacterized protein n=1 Tax=Actinoallomurus oryzae TaxID=502180 RepID=A0ABP8PIK5_9ACTN
MAEDVDETGHDGEAVRVQRHGIVPGRCRTDLDHPVTLDEHIGADSGPAVPVVDGAPAYHHRKSHPPSVTAALPDGFVRRHQCAGPPLVCGNDAPITVRSVKYVHDD